MLLLCFAPLIQGGNRPLALLVLETLSCLLLIGVFMRWQQVQQLGRPMLLLLTMLLLLPLLQLIPLPFPLWSTLTAQSGFTAALQLAEPGYHQARPVSLSPALTEFAWLALLPSVLVFVYSFSLKTSVLRALVPVFLVIAAFEAVLGLAQYGAGLSSSGTYANRDHLAGMLEMALPLSLALLAASLGSVVSSQRRYYRSWRTKLRAWLYTYCSRSTLYAMLSLGLLLGLIFTRSRSGIVLVMLMVVLCAIAFSSRLGGRNVYGMMGTWVAAGLSLAVLVGLVPVLDRFAYEDPLKDARWTIYSSVLQAVNDYLPLGSGAGTFSQAFQRFHPNELTNVFINHAHNDYLEWVMEGGIVAAVIIIGLLVLYALRWLTLMMQAGAWSTFKFIQVGAGIGLFLILLHSLVDFNLHIPANQIYFAFLAALFFHHAEQEEPKDDTPSAHHHHHTHLESQPPAAPKSHPILPGNNPFADEQ